MKQLEIRRNLVQINLLPNSLFFRTQLTSTLDELNTRTDFQMTQRAVVNQKGGTLN